METFRKAKDLMFDLLLSRSDAIRIFNLGMVFGLSSLSAFFSFPTYNTEIEPMPILELDDHEEVIYLPAIPVSKEEIRRRALRECDETRDEYRHLCEKDQTNKSCGLWMYHVARCNRWRNPPPIKESAKDTGEESETGNFDGGMHPIPSHW